MIGMALTLFSKCSCLQIAEATANTRVPVLSFSCLITNNQTAGVSWGVTGRLSDPCLEPALTADHAAEQVRESPEFLRDHRYGNILVPFSKGSNSGEVCITIKPGLLPSGATAPVDSSPFPLFAFHSRTLGYFYVPCDERGTRAVSNQDIQSDFSAHICVLHLLLSVSSESRSSLLGAQQGLGRAQGCDSSTSNS